MTETLEPPVLDGKARKLAALANARRVAAYNRAAAKLSEHERMSQSFDPVPPAVEEPTGKTYVISGDAGQIIRRLRINKLVHRSTGKALGQVAELPGFGPSDIKFLISLSPRAIEHLNAMGIETKKETIEVFHVR